jgi:hypothetical protein
MKLRHKTKRILKQMPPAVLKLVTYLFLLKHKYTYMRGPKADFSIRSKFCDNDTLVQMSCFITLLIVLSLSKNRHFYFSKLNISEAAFCLRL